MNTIRRLHAISHSRDIPAPQNPGRSVSFGQRSQLPVDDGSYILSTRGGQLTCSSSRRSPPSHGDHLILAVVSCGALRRAPGLEIVHDRLHRKHHLRWLNRRCNALGRWVIHGESLQLRLPFCYLEQIKRRPPTVANTCHPTT